MYKIQINTVTSIYRQIYGVASWYYGILALEYLYDLGFWTPKLLHFCCQYNHFYAVKLKCASYKKLFNVPVVCQIKKVSFRATRHVVLKTWYNNIQNTCLNYKMHCSSRRTIYLGVCMCAFIELLIYLMLCRLN